jgi:hypothetical protein
VAVPRLWAIFNANQKALESKKKISPADADFAQRVYWALVRLGEEPGQYPD